MAVAYDNSGRGVNTDSANNVSTESFAVSGDYLLVGVANSDSTRLEPTAVKWGGPSGASLTKIGSLSLGSFMYMTLWELKAPTAQTSTVYVEWPGAQAEKMVVAASYSGVDQTTPHGTVATATGTSPLISVAAASEAGDLVVDFAGFLDISGSGFTLTAGAGQTSREEIEGSINNPYGGCALSEKTATGMSTTMSWTVESAFIVDWGAFALALNADAGGGAGPSITDVDTDESITSDQTNVTINGTGFDNATVEVRQGSTTVEQSIDSQSATSIQFDVVFEGTTDLKYGAATLAVINDDGQEDTIDITIAPPSGVNYVDLGTPNETAENRITAVPDLEAGDQLEISNVQGGTIDDVHVNADATFDVAEGVTAFDVRVWDVNDSTWGDWATQSITTGTVELEGIVSICATIASPGTLRAGALAAFGGVASLVAVPAAAGTFVSDVTQRFDGVPAICATIASPGTLRAGALAAFGGVASLVAVPAAAGTFVSDVTQRFDGVPAICAAIASPGTLRAGALAAFEGIASICATIASPGTLRAGALAAFGGVASLVAVPAVAGTFVSDVTQRFDGVPAICAVDAQAGTAEYILPQIFDGSPSVCAVVARPGALPRTADGMAGGELGSGRLGRRGIGSGELVNLPWLEET